MHTAAGADPIAHLARTIRRERSQLGVALALAAIVHGAGSLAFARTGMRRTAEPRATTAVVDIDIPRPPPPMAPTATRDPPKVDVRLRSLAPPTHAAAVPPPPAQAAAVLTKKEDPNEPVDLTTTIVTGAAAVFPGGTTAASGTSPDAVHAVSAPGDPRGSRGVTAAAAPAEPDRSRGPILAGERSWNCPFPPEADAEGIDDAVVTIRVSVGASGEVTGVTLLADPGHGFGGEARRCAMNKRWAAALGRDGAPAAGTAVVKVRFSR